MGRKRPGQEMGVPVHPCAKWNSTTVCCGGLRLTVGAGFTPQHHDPLAVAKLAASLAASTMRQDIAVGAGQLVLQHPGCGTHTLNASQLRAASAVG